MVRLHPDYMKPALTAGKHGDLEGYNRNIGKGLEYWTEVFADTIGNMDSIEAPLIITALKEIADAYTQAIPGADKAVEWLQSRVQKEVTVVRVNVKKYGR